MVAWSAREQRGFTTNELAGLIQQATGVDVRAVIEQWLAAALALIGYAYGVAPAAGQKRCGFCRS